MAPVRDDYLLRMIDRAFEVLRRVLGRSNGEAIPDSLRELDAAIGETLGASGEVAQRLDAATAVPLVGDPNRAGIWARLLAQRALLLRETGDPAAAAATARALEVAVEARRMCVGDPRMIPEVAQAIQDAIAISLDRVPDPSPSVRPPDSAS